ncbi:HIT family protein [Maridesulfovibrio bastinii]|uniref:HIT family protein n=1 Tax=Maridesulfovibrio bastinii TaxID=47157 RepID=UPI000415A514|nr:HIT family protein [Maridesulfovibrio bastinii]
MSDNDCIFCKIIKGEIPCFKIYETDKIFCFLDIGPVNKGHALVIPKEHYENLWALPDDLGKEIFKACKTVGKAIVEATKADGLNVIMNNNKAAGQLVFHAHFHLIPRFDNDGHEHWKQQEYPNMDEPAGLAEKISSLIA